MSLHPTTIRLPDSLWKLVEREAERDGVSANAFITHSVLLRIGYRAGARGDGKEIIEMFERVLNE